MARRVVVTGLGVCCPLGTGVAFTWKRLLDSASGITRLPDLPRFEQIPSRVVGLVPRGDEPGAFRESDWVTPPERKSKSPASVYALCASSEALKDAGWEPEGEQRYRTGVAIGSVFDNTEAEIVAIEQLSRNMYRRITPYLIPLALSNMPAGNVSIHFGLCGPNHSVATACAAGTHSIGDAACMIRRGAADVMVTGATEASVNPLVMAGFCRANALSTKFNNTPELASRPFDPLRDGFVIAEGAGVVILEELEHAKARKAKIYAEILGYGMTGDGYHITKPSGDGAIRTIQAALNDAGLPPEAVGHINAHATSTPVGDSFENKAIKTVFGDHAYNLLVSANKSSIGHLMAACGGVEAIFTILAIKHGVAPPTLNLKHTEPEFDLNYVPAVKAKWGGADRRVAVSNSFGFGGTNAALCIGEYLS